MSAWPAPWLRERLGYAPRDLALFAEALTHRSVSGAHYERLEFLGDAVLNLIVAEHLFRRFPDAHEGDLSRLRAHVVSTPPLAEIGAAIGIGEVVQLGTGELRNGGFRRESILADSLEALFGALFLDGGFESVRAVIERLLAGRLSSLPPVDELKDAKTRLQEYLQSRALALPRYSVESMEGEPHERLFHVICVIRGFDFFTEGAGLSRRRAEQEAAERMLTRLKALP